MAKGAPIWSRPGCSHRDYDCLAGRDDGGDVDSRRFGNDLFAILGFFGYKSIEERSVNAAEKKAAEIAEVMVVKSIADFRAKEQAVAMGAGQPLTDQKKKHEKPKANPAKITSDSSLRDKGKNNDAH